MTITHIVITQGPGGPNEAGASEDVIRRFAGRVLILVACLDHQAIFEVYGGHSCSVGGDHAWEDLCDPPRCTRCPPRDSRPVSCCPIPLLLVGTVDTIPSCLIVTAKTSNGLIMGVRHKSFRVESILSEHGYKLLHHSLVNNCTNSLDRCNIHIHITHHTILFICFVSLADTLISCESSSDEDWKRSLSFLPHRSHRRRDVARRKPERETGRKSDDFLPHTLLQGKLRYARYLNQSWEWI